MKFHATANPIGTPRERCYIHGSKSLRGRIQICGAKNSALPIIVATLMTANGRIHKLQNVPDITDVHIMLRILSVMGCYCSFSDKTLLIDSRKACHTPQKSREVSDYNFEGQFDNLTRQIRGSVLLLGPLLARFGTAYLPLPGGCKIGARPVDLFLEGLNALGANLIVDEASNCLIGSCKELVGTTFQFKKVSVCATEALIMAAVVAKGETVILNAAQEPDVVELVRFLKSMGAKIEGEGTSTVKVEGVPLTSLSASNKDFRIRGDSIEAGTFLFATAATGGEIHVDCINPNDLRAVLNILEEMGCKIKTGDEWIYLSRFGTLCPVSIYTEPFPGFPTDLQQVATVCCTQAIGISKIREMIFPDRIGHIPQVAKLGGSVHISVNEKDANSRCFNDTGKITTLQLTGPVQLEGKCVRPTDLRCAASLVVAGLVATGKTCIEDIHFLDRGYSHLCEKFRALSADIGRELVFPSGLQILCDEPMSKRTTLRIGGNARYFLVAKNVSILSMGLIWAHERGLDVFVLGCGSNVVVEDAGFDGLVINYVESSIDVLQESKEESIIKVSAGYNWDKFVAFTVNRGLSGVECLSGIPGTVGASPVQNIGAYGQDVSQSIKSVRVMAIKDGTIKHIRNVDCMFSYRTSNFKSKWRGKYVIISAEFCLSRKQRIVGRPGDTSGQHVFRRLKSLGLSTSPSNIRMVVLDLRKEKSMLLCDDDPNCRSVGSFFMNPIVCETTCENLRQRLRMIGVDDGNMPTKSVPILSLNHNNEGTRYGIQISAAWLIEKAGYHRGYVHKECVGVGLSSKHCLALISKDLRASATSLLKLSQIIQTSVHDVFGICLSKEPVILGLRNLYFPDSNTFANDEYTSQWKNKTDSTADNIVCVERNNETLINLNHMSYIKDGNKNESLDLSRTEVSSSSSCSDVTI